jgi:YHS domain-containing protein
MLRIAFLIFLVFAALLVLRALRLLVAAYFRRPGAGEPPGAVEGEMVKDPICGTWIDRRLALAAKRAGEWVPVCSEKCRSAAESA